MFYIIAKEHMDSGLVRRNIIAVANKSGFADLEDVSSIGTPSKLIMEEDRFNEMLQDGYLKKEDALNDKNMRRDITDFAGPFWKVEFSVVDEAELKNLYKEILSRK